AVMVRPRLEHHAAAHEVVHAARLDEGQTDGPARRRRWVRESVRVALLQVVQLGEAVGGPPENGVLGDGAHALPGDPRFAWCAKSLQVLGSRSRRHLTFLPRYVGVLRKISLLGRQRGMIGPLLALPAASVAPAAIGPTVAWPGEDAGGGGRCLRRSAPCP